MHICAEAKISFLQRVDEMPVSGYNDAQLGWKIQSAMFEGEKMKRNLSTTQIILLSFLITILLGSLLLALPISSANGKAVPYIDALFTAATSTCVTGLVTLQTASTWSLFGQIVILILIQIGGLGVITIMAGIMLLLKRKMGISDRLLIQDAFNLNTLSGLIQFVKNVLLGTLIIEAVLIVIRVTHQEEYEEKQRLKRQKLATRRKIIRPKLAPIPIPGNGKQETTFAKHPLAASSSKDAKKSKKND